MIGALKNGFHAALIFEIFYFEIGGQGYGTTTKTYINCILPLKCHLLLKGLVARLA